MQFSTVARRLEGIPYTSAAKGRVFYDFILKHKPRRVLELGFAHGVSSCYFAAALDEFGGKLDAVDLDVGFEPSLEELRSALGFENLISIHREKSSYTWFLKKKLEEQFSSGNLHTPYDFCFIDGPKDWTNDGLSFFLVDKLLSDGGIIMFDDYSWTYRAFGRNKGYVFENMSEEELAQPQIEAVFRLLVMQHPSYSGFEIIDDNLAIAKKIKSEDRVLEHTTKFSLAYRIMKAVKKMNRR